MMPEPDLYAAGDDIIWNSTSLKYILPSNSSAPMSNNCPFTPRSSPNIS
ncbi:hypothetical protein ACFLSQ_11590 [Bacteroidota bacterium]